MIVVKLVVKNLLANAGDIELRVQPLSQKDPLADGMETHSSTLAWKIPWMEERSRLQFMGLQRVGHD